MSLYGDARLPANFWSKVTYSEDGCWLWTASKNYGYGAFSWKGKTPNAHRLLYLELVGPVPNGFVVDHLCHGADESCKGGATCPHRACVRPDHLEPVSQTENKLRGRSVPAMRARQTHCKNGHPLEGENLWIDHGGRVCRICKVEKNRQWRIDNPEAFQAAQQKYEEKRRSSPDLKQRQAESTARYLAKKKAERLTES